MMTDKELAAWKGVEKQRDFGVTFMALLACLFGIAILIGALAAVNDYECQDATVIVQQGDSLWSIVEDHCTGDVRAAVTAIDMATVVIQPGQRVVLP